MPENLRETDHLGAVREATPATAGRTIAVDLITPGWGSSGYYSPQVLEAAGRDRIFAAGTHMYLDHPTATEDMDRPERSVRDLAGVLTSDATWNGSALTAEARVFAPYQQLVSEAKDAIGVSIRAGGDIELGEAEGRKGRIVTKLVHGTSADFVTHAGRGGKVRELLESARASLTEARNVGQHLESRLHQDFTNRADDMAANGHLTRDERIHLSNAVGQGLSAFAGHLEANAPQLYQRDIYDEPAEKPDVTEAAPAAPTRKGGLVPELSEAEVTALRDSASKAEAARDAALAEAAAAKEQVKALQTKTCARGFVSQKVAESTKLGNLTQSRLVEHVLNNTVIFDDPEKYEAGLVASIESAVKVAEAEAAENGTAPVRESYGAFGSHQPAATKTEAVSEADLAAYDAASARTFHRAVTGA